MNQCIICGSKKLLPIKVINGTKILECGVCTLAVTGNKRKSDSHYLYNSSNFYKLENYENIDKKQVNKFKRIISLLEHNLHKGEILEVGAGFGLLSSLLHNNPKYKITALEPNLPLEYLKGKKDIQSIKSTYEEYLVKSKKKYDAILFIDVLEHFKDPSAIIEKTQNIMKSDGILIINLPNYKSIMAKLISNWSWWMIEDHYFHFSKKSLNKFLNKNGFTVKKIDSYESVLDFKKNLDGNFMEISNPLTRKVMKGFTFLVFFPIYFLSRHIFWKLGKGGLLVAVAQNKK